MRSVRVLFTNVSGFDKYVEVYLCLGALGIVREHFFNYKDAGHGCVVLCTHKSNREIEDALSEALPGLFTGIENISEEARADCS